MLYSDLERSIMAAAERPGLRSVNASPAPLRAIVADFGLAGRLAGTDVLELAPAQCDFLDLARTCGALAIGVDPDPAVVALGRHRGHSMSLHDLYELDDDVPTARGLFCRGGLNPLRFANRPAALDSFLTGLGRLVAAADWVWFAPFLNPGSQDAQALAETSRTLERWRLQMGLQRWRPDAAAQSRYGIGYRVPEVEVWLKGLTAPDPFVPAARAPQTAAVSTAEPMPESRSAPAPAAGVTPEGACPTATAEQVSRGVVHTREYLVEFMRILRRRGDVECITFDDLDWPDGADDPAGHPREWERWQQSLRERRRDPDKAYLLITHDTDSGPAQSIRLARIEHEHRVRSSIFTFVRWPDPRDPGQPPRPYDIDWVSLRRLREAGFCIGYHANALHVAGFDESRVFDVFREDVQTMRARDLDPRFYTAHGGPASPSTGRLNRDFDYLGATGLPLRWVGNGGHVRTAGKRSDGGLSMKARKGLALPDFHGFARAMRRGQRYWILMHPQYYDV